MHYMQSFNWRLRQLREARNLSQTELAAICHVEETLIVAWESPNPRRRSYPGVDQLVDLCLATDAPLDTLLDLPDAADLGQMELPGLTQTGDTDLTESLKRLEAELSRIQLSEEERELLRRFSKTSTENRRLVMKLLGR
ncbi:MAG: helix-turn-helix transcriptional regulator [Oleiphilaceae bacterium]|nr:helix-turn-helix transcriptional regulator [Oleiphilaceae bacterium]